MTPSTEELTRLLTGAADDIVERRTVPGPDAPLLWRQGRRVTWAGRAAAGGIALVVVLLVVTGGLLVRGLPATAPARGGTPTYPKVVSDLFVEEVQAGSAPVFGVVTTVPTQSQPDDIDVIERRGALATLVVTDPSGHRSPVLSGGGTTLSLAPDGRRAWTSEGIVDLDDGFVTRPLGSSAGDPADTGGRGVWSPDSEHVLLDTADGPTVLNGYRDVVLAPLPGDRDVRAAGWSDATTVVGVRPSTDGGLDVVTRGLTDPTWQTVAPVAADAVAGAGSPSQAFAAPDGSRLLLVWSALAGTPRSVVVDARSGARVPFAGESASTAVAWDRCAPVWQSGQPLLADRGLRRPATGESVMSFSGHHDHGCVSLAGDELTGTPVAGAAGAWQERAWQLWLTVLPWGAALVVAGAIWMVVALRRSRRHGEDFLPMVLRLPF